MNSTLPPEDAALLEEEARAERAAIETENNPGARAQGMTPSAGVVGEPSPVPVERERVPPVGGASGGSDASGPNGGGGAGEGDGAAVALDGGLVRELLAARREREKLGVYLDVDQLDTWETYLRWKWKDVDGTLVKESLLKTPANLLVILQGDPRWAGRFRFNAMTLFPHYDGRQVTDSDLTAFRVALEHQHKLAFGRDAMAEAVRLVAESNPFDPRVDWLKSLPPWDGKNRLDTVAKTYFGSDQPLAPAFVKCFFVGALRRVFEPGCRMQSVFTLQGPQGFKKSTFFSILFGAWFSDTRIDFGSPREAAIQLAGAWCHELGECEELTLYREDTAVKRGITSAEDTFRRPYAAMTEKVRRSSFFVGTTNEETFLKDRTGTGSRRWHVVRVSKRCDEALLRSERDQLFAEALELLRRGTPHWLTDTEETARERAAVEHYQIDVWDDLVTRWLAKGEKLHDLNTYGDDGGVVRRVGASNYELLTEAVGLERARITDADTRHLGVCMKRLGWLRSRGRLERGIGPNGKPKKGAPETVYLAPIGWTKESFCPDEDRAGAEPASPEDKDFPPF